jgi:hypothetical protein
MIPICPPFVVKRKATDEQQLAVVRDLASVAVQ